MRGWRVAVLVAGLVPAAAWGASEVSWVDPALGCGKNFAGTGRMADLPGCSGKIPRDAPEVEQLLRDAKRALLDADEAIGKKKLEKADGLIQDAEKLLAKKPAEHPTLPDRWEESVPVFQRAIAQLRQKRKMSSHADKLRATFAAAHDASKGVQEPGGAPKAIDAARACVAEVDATRAEGIDGAIELAYDDKVTRSLDAARAVCETLRKQADGLVRQREAQRAALRKRLKGDRLTTFDAHPGVLPQGGADLARAALWTYTTATGVEVFSWKGNKLVSRTTRAK